MELEMKQVKGSETVAVLPAEQERVRPLCIFDIILRCMCICESYLPLVLPVIEDPEQKRRLETCYIL
jgi:hypothetical protein